MSAKNTTKKKDSVWSPVVIIVAILCAAVLVGAVALAIVNRSGYFRENTVMMTIGDQEVNQIEFEYYYGAQYQVYNSYFSLSSSNVNLKTTKCYMDNTMTWHEYLVKMAKEQLVNDYILAAEAEKNGFELTDESKEILAGLPEDLEAAAEQNGVSVNSYLNLVYGAKNLTVERLVEYTTRGQLATDYATHIVEGYEYDDTKIEEYFNENRKEFELAEYYTYTIKAIENGKTVEEQKTAFEAITGENTAEQFKDLLKELYPPEEGKEFVDTSYKKTDASFIEEDETSEWLFDEKTENGAIKVFAKESGEGDAKTTTYTAVCLINRGKDDAKVATMRHILFKTENLKDDSGNDLKDADGKTLTNKDEVMKKAEEVLNTWKNGEKTEDSFAKLADEHTEDEGSKGNGGLYENFKQGDMVEKIDTWIFPEKEEDQPKVGDTTIVDVVSTNYQGVHIVYFLGYGDAWKIEVENAMKDKDYEDFLKGLKDAVEVTYDDANIAKIG